MKDVGIETIEINGKKYIPADSAAVAPIPGKRFVLVLDRGWIVAGDVTEANGRIKLTRVVQIDYWQEIGFDGMIANPKTGKTKLRPIPNTFDVPTDTELFRVSVSDSWGL